MAPCSSSVPTLAGNLKLARMSWWGRLVYATWYTWLLRWLKTGVGDCVATVVGIQSYELKFHSASASPQLNYFKCKCALKQMSFADHFGTNACYTPGADTACQERAVCVYTLCIYRYIHTHTITPLDLKKKKCSYITIATKNRKQLKSRAFPGNKRGKN